MATIIVSGTKLGDTSAANNERQPSKPGFKIATRTATQIVPPLLNPASVAIVKPQSRSNAYMNPLQLGLLDGREPQTIEAVVGKLSLDSRQP